MLLSTINYYHLQNRCLYTSFRPSAISTTVSNFESMNQCSFLWNLAPLLAPLMSPPLTFQFYNFLGNLYGHFQCIMGGIGSELSVLGCFWFWPFTFRLSMAWHNLSPIHLRWTMQETKGKLNYRIPSKISLSGKRKCFIYKRT